jgi:hypothetical protein
MHPRKKAKCLGPVFIPYVWGVSENFKHIKIRYSIRALFGTKHTLNNGLINTRKERGPQQTAQNVYNIPSEYGRSYSGETGRLLA